MKIKLLKFKSVNSTNDIALNLIKRNKFKPTLISAEQQIKGRGTMGKKWVSKKGNLYLTIYFEINQKKINFKHYAVLNAYLIKYIIRKNYSDQVQIKWPNDLLIKKKKICGILQEVLKNEKKNFLVIGIGINTNFNPITKQFNSISLKDITKKKINNNKLLENIKKEYENLLRRLKTYSFQELKKIYK